MSKTIAAINMTIDGIWDHTVLSPDEEIHDHYAELIRNAGALLYGSTTFELMKYWRDMALIPSGKKAMDEFAVVMDRVPKVVFSHKLKNTEWASARLSGKSIEEEVSALKKDSEKDILVGSRSLIIQLLRAGLIDELQLCIHPVVAGSGSTLFESINFRTEFKLLRTKTFRGSAITLYYQPTVFAGH